MSEITLGLRMGAKLWDASTDELPRMTSHSRWLMTAAADEIERLTAAIKFAHAAGFEWPSDPLPPRNHEQGARDGDS